MAKKFLVGLIGEGIEHSLTPDLHMREGRELGLEYEYRIIDILDPQFSGLSLEKILSEVKLAGYDAVNVTYPFKQQVLEFLVTNSESVSDLSASNLVLNLQSVPHGENTDWSGFEFALRRTLTDKNKSTVIQIGTGGAGGATAFALLRWGAERLFLADLDFEKAGILADGYQKLFPNQQVQAISLAQALELFPEANGVVQATPIGMYTHPGMPFSIESLNPTAWVADVIYRPVETELIRAARAAGHTVLPGGLMAIGQAADSLRLITGLEPDIERMTRHFQELLDDETALTRARGF